MSRASISRTAVLTSSNFARQPSISTLPARSSGVDEAAGKKHLESREKRVATLRILIPVAIITVMALTKWAPSESIQSALTAVAQTPAVTHAAEQNYFPAQFANRGHGAEEHVQNF